MGGGGGKQYLKIEIIEILSCDIFGTSEAKSENSCVLFLPYSG